MVGCGERRVLEGLREGPCARDLEVCFGVRTTMAEGEAGAKIRVVRCPKCEKLLPELGNFSVYSCGGCGATLQAKGQMPVSESSPQSEKASSLGVSESDSVKKDLAPDSSPGTDNEFSRTEGRREEELDLKSKSSAPALGNSVPGTETDSSLSKEQNLKLNDTTKANGTEIRSDKFRRRSKLPSDLSPVVNEPDKMGAKNGRETKEILDRFSQAHQQQKGDGRDGLPRIPSESIRSAQYPDEGPSDYSCNRRYHYGDGERNGRWNADGATRVGYLEQDRAEILRMLDELRVQVQRSCEVTDKQKPCVPADKTINSSSSYVHQDCAKLAPESSSSLSWNPSRHAPLLHEHNMGMLNFYPTVPQNDIPGYADPLAYRRPPYNMSDYAQRHIDGYLYGQLDPDPIMPYHHEGFYHQPACTCMHCNPRLFSVPEQGPPSIYNHRRVPYFVNNHEFYPVHGPPVFGTRSSNTTGGNALHSIDPSTDRRTTISMSARRPCQPVAGAAPFVTCYNCFELLQLPENTFPLKKHAKLRCGSCSNINTLHCDGNRLIVSVTPRPSHVSSGNCNNSCNSPSNGAVSADEKLVLPYIFTVNDHERIEKTHGLNFSGSEKMQGLSSSSSMSGHIESPESEVSQKDVPISSEIPLEAQIVSRVPSLPLCEHFGYSLSDQVIDGSGNGSRSKRSDQERNVSLSGNFKQNSSKDVQVATEMDLTADEYPPPGLCQDSWDMINKDEAQPKAVKAGESFLAGLVKKSLRLNQSAGHGRSKVSINGHHIPDRLVKRAERLAGPVFSGEYWYDYRAGFWGIMGHPCLGIIPPFIEEFNYPMPKNCAGGNTGVLVNGRELHQKDLDLLCRRGLPDTGGSYIIDISGRVWEEDSGEELDSLGRLAPTVEKVKRGFGMRVPRDLI